MLNRSAIHKRKPGGDRPSVNLAEAGPGGGVDAV